MRRLKLLLGAGTVAALCAWLEPAAALDWSSAYRSAQQSIDSHEREVAGIQTAMRRAAAPTRAASRMLADGDLLLRSRDYERAAIVFNELLDKYPNDRTTYAEALYRLGETYYQSAQYLSARRVYVRVVEESNNARLAAYKPQALARLTDIAIKTRDLAALDDVYQRLHQQPSQEAAPVLAYARGRVFLEKGDEAAARQALASVPSSSSHYPQAQYLLALMALRQANVTLGAEQAQDQPVDKRAALAPAIAAFRQVTRVTPSSDKQQHVVDLAWLAVGRLLAECGQLADAAEAYNHVRRESREFGTMLFELASVYVRMGDTPRAQRALEVLAITEPDHQDVADSGLLRGDLQLRAGQFKNAHKTFVGVRDQFEPMHQKVEAFLASTNDPSVYYDKLVHEQLDILDASSPLPPLAIQWAREGQDGPEAFAVVDEVVQTRKLLRNTEALVQRLTTVMNSPNRVRAFPELRAGEQASLALINGLMRARVTLAQGLDDVEKDVTGELAAVRSERRALQARVLQLPVSEADFASREEGARREWNRTSQRVQQLELQVNTLQSMVNALSRVLKESAARGVVRDPASSRRLHDELEANKQDLQVYERKLEELRRAVEYGRLAAGFADPRYGDDQLRARFKHLLSKEAELLVRGAAGPRAATYGLQLAPLLAKADQVEARVEAIRADIARQVDTKTREIVSLIEAEQGKMVEYVSRLDMLDEEARLVVGEVAKRNFGRVRDRLQNVVLRADVGITEEAWEVREEQLRRVRNLQTERARSERLLSEELREVLDDMGDQD